MLVEAEAPGEGAAHAVALEPSDRLLGLGDKALSLDRRGDRVEMWNTDAYQYGRGTDPLYKSVPFVLKQGADDAVGLFYDNTWRATFDLGAADARRFAWAASGGALDLYVLAAPTPLAVVQAYARLTGRTPLVPNWALGYHQCRYSYMNEAEVRDVAREFRERHIPCDTLYFDIHYMDGFRVFTWDTERFPDPPGLLADLAGDGFRSVVIVDPGVKADDPEYDVFRRARQSTRSYATPTARRSRGEVWPGTCAFPDYTSADVRAWWGQLHAGLLADGVDGVWNDMNEPALFSVAHVEGTMDGEHNVGTIPDDTRHDFEGRGADHAQMHNVYGMQMQRATFDGLRQLAPGKRPFTITRAAYAGAQRFGTGWTGDNTATWDHLRLAVQTAVAGRLRDVVRRHRRGRLRRHAVGRAGRALDAGRRAHAAVPQPLGHRHAAPGAVAVRRRGRARVPRGHRDPLPAAPGAVHRALASGDTRDADHAPARARPPRRRDGPPDEPAGLLRRRQPAGPAGRGGRADRARGVPAREPGGWFDLATGERFDGRQTVWTQTPLDRLPLFVRGGSVLPLGPVRQHTGEPAERLALHVYAAPGRHTSRLYDDAGDGWDAGWTCRLDLEDDGAVLRLTPSVSPAKPSASETASGWRPEWAGWDVVVHGLSAAPHSVRVDGAEAEAAWDGQTARFAVAVGAGFEIVR